jgi:uncharacterized protein (TIGR00730 family)
MYRLCVLCGSETGSTPHYKNLAKQFGQLAARNNIELVYGGGDIGLMGIVANASLAEGGRVTGIIPSFFKKREIAHKNLSELIITNGMHERKSIMFNKSDAIVVLPGGFGTLDEFFEILTWKQIGLHQKNIYIINYNNYWDPLKKLIEHILSSGFANQDPKTLFKFVTDEKNLFKSLKSETIT